jgi:hypothetical protein
VSVSLALLGSDFQIWQVARDAIDAFRLLQGINLRKAFQNHLQICHSMSLGNFL